MSRCSILESRMLQVAGCRCYLAYPMFPSICNQGVKDRRICHEKTDDDWSHNRGAETMMTYHGDRYDTIHTIKTEDDTSYHAYDIIPSPRYVLFLHIVSDPIFNEERFEIPITSVLHITFA